MVVYPQRQAKRASLLFRKAVSILRQLHAVRNDGYTLLKPVQKRKACRFRGGYRYFLCASIQTVSHSAHQHFYRRGAAQLPKEIMPVIGVTRHDHGRIAMPYDAKGKAPRRAFRLNVDDVRPPCRQLLQQGIVQREAGAQARIIECGERANKIVVSIMKGLIPV